MHRAETEIVNVRWSGVARNVVPCSLVERCEQRSASGVGGGVHGGRIEDKARGGGLLWRDDDAPFHFTKALLTTR